MIPAALMIAVQRSVSRAMKAAVEAGDGPAPDAVPRLFAIGNDLGAIGARAFMLAAAVVAVDLVRRLVGAAPRASA